MTPIKILFVCHGNICRSPMAEFIFKNIVLERGIADKFYIESAAVSREEIGNDIYPPAKRELSYHGIPFETRHARQMTRADYENFDIIFVMDESNIRRMKSIIGEDDEHKVYLLLERGIADPWYTDDFGLTYRDIVEGCMNYLNKWQEDSFAIRRTTEADFDRIQEIYARAREFMRSHGNPNQWNTKWPPAELLHEDIKQGRSYVCECDGKVEATFVYIQGVDVDPTYSYIEDGAWKDDSEYGAVHRIASSGKCKGIGTFCINWAFAQCGHLRMDTHGDNEVMKNLLNKLGFERCGIIYVEEDDYPRIAFEKVINEGNCTCK